MDKKIEQADKTGATAPSRRAMIWLYIGAIGLLIMCLSPIGRLASNLDVVKDLLRRLGHVFPAINFIAGISKDTNQEKLVVASQWTLFPLYFVLILLQQKPWEAQKLKPGVSKAKITVAVAISALVGLMFVAGDVGAPFPSFYLGTIFDPRLDIGALAFAYQSWFGFALAAFVGPLFDAVIWALLLCIPIAIIRSLVSEP